MKINQTLFYSGAMALACASILTFTGCATTPADQAANMASSVTKTSQQLEASRAAVTQVLTTLNQLVTQPEGDMRSQYNDYLASVKNLVSTSDKVQSSVNEMVANGRAYFMNWSNQVAAISDPALKKLSDERKEKASAGLAELKANTDKVRASYAPLEKSLNDVGIYLGNNLTADGIAALKPRLNDIKINAVAVRDSLNDVVQSLDKFSTTLAASAASK